MKTIQLTLQNSNEVQAGGRDSKVFSPPDPEVPEKKQRR